MSDLLRPIIGIENRTAQEVFDIMCDRISSRLRSTPAGVTVTEERALRDEIERLKHEVQSAGALRLRMEAHKARADALQAKLDEAKAVLEQELPAPDWYSDGHQIMSQPFDHNGFVAQGLYTERTIRTFLSTLTEHIDGDVLNSAGKSNTSEPETVNGGLRGERQARASNGWSDGGKCWDPPAEAEQAAWRVFLDSTKDIEDKAAFTFLTRQDLDAFLRVIPAGWLVTDIHEYQASMVQSALSALSPSARGGGNG